MPGLLTVMLNTSHFVESWGVYSVSGGVNGDRLPGDVRFSLL